MINKFLSVVAVAGMSLWGSAAKADLFIVGSLDGFVTSTLLASSGNNDFAQNAAPVALGNFLITSVNATGVDLLPFPENLLSNATSISSTTGGTLDLRITQTDITLAPQAATFVSSATINVLTGGTTIQMSTFWSPTNTNPATSLLSTTAVLTDIGTFGPEQQVRNVGAGAFSVTELFHIVAPGPGSVQATIRLAVPGPVVGAGLPGLITACFGLLALARRRRQQRTAIA